MAQETKTEGAPRDILCLMEKKIRNLEKRKARLDLSEKELEMGNQLTQNQLLALEKKEEVLIKLEAVRELRISAEQYVRNDEHAVEVKARKAEEAMHNKIMDTVAQVLRSQYLLDEGLLQDKIGEDQVLEVLRAASRDARKKNFRSAARFWIQVVEANPDQLAAGVTFQAAHERLTAIGDMLEKLAEDKLNERIEGGREGSPSTPSGGDGSEIAPGPETHATTEAQNVNKQQNEISASPTEDLDRDDELDAQRVVVSSEQHPTIVPNNRIDHPCGPPIVIPVIGPCSVSPVRPGEDTIQFGSIEPVGQHPAMVQTMLAAPKSPAAEIPSPDDMFGDREFDFIQDDLTLHKPAHQTSPVHMDPAVVYAAGVKQHDAPYHRLPQLQQNQQQQRQMKPSLSEVQSHETNDGSAEPPEQENGKLSATGKDVSREAAADTSTTKPPARVEDLSGNGYHERDDGERRTSRENQRHNRQGGLEGGKALNRGMNDRWSGYGGGHWGNGERRQAAYGHPHFRHNNAYGGGKHNNGTSRSTTARREPTAQGV